MRSVLIVSVAVIVLVFLICKFLGGTSGNDQILKTQSCKRTRESKIYAESVIQRLHNDLVKIHPEIKTVLKFAPLECCDLEDSVTEDKKRVYICVKGKGGKYYNYNKLMQVAIHELAHVLSKTVDPEHKSDEFISNYKHLMDRAEHFGLIDSKRLDQRY